MTSTVEKPPGQGAAVADQPHPDNDGYNLTHRQIVTILIGLMSGMFLAALDQTIVGTSIRTIADDLQGLSLQAWATTAYLITATIVTPIYGKLSDIYGRKPFYLTAISVFLVGSIACTFVQEMWQLAVFRAVQGLGAGGLMSLAMTILGDIVPPRQRARYQGFFLSVFGVSTVLGPVLGGVFAGQDDILGIDGWRWVFLVNVPIGIVALFVVAKVLNVPHERHEAKIDWWGGVALVIGLVPLLLVAEQGREWGWASAGSLTCYGIGAFGILLFIAIETKMKDVALIPLRLFRNSTFTVAIVGGFIVGVAMFGSITLVPQYLQIVQGYTPTEAGLMTLPLMLGIMSASVLSGQITSRTGRYKIFPIIGTALMAAGTFLFTTVEWNSPVWQPMVYMFIIGFGLGNCMQTLIIAVQNAGPRRDMGVSTAAATFFRQIGGTLGVAVFLSILFSTVSDNIASAFADRGIQMPASGGGGGNVLSDSSFIEKLPPALAEPFKIGFTDSITSVFFVGGCVALLAFVVVWFMREIPLAGGPSAASTMEGGEALLEQEEQERTAVFQSTGGSATGQRPDSFDAWADADAALDREPELVGAGRHSVSGENMDGEYQLAAASLGNGNGHSNGHSNGHAAGTATIGGGHGNGQHGNGHGPGNGSGNGSGVGNGPGTGNGAGTGTETGTGNGAAMLSGEPEVPAPEGRSVNGHVRRQDGSSVARAALTLIDQRGRQVARGIGRNDGSYSMAAPEVGSYVLIVSAPGHQPQASSVIVGQGPAKLDVMLSGSGGVSGIVRLTGRGTPLANATVTLTDERGEVTGSSITREDGRYAFHGIGAGHYTLVANGERLRPAALTLNVPDNGTVTHDIELASSVLLSGVARTENGKVVPDARITVLDAQGNMAAVARTDEAGRYVVSDLPEGGYTVVASGYPPATSQVTLLGGDAQHDVRLGYEQALDQFGSPMQKPQPWFAPERS